MSRRSVPWRDRVGIFLANAAFRLVATRELRRRLADTIYHGMQHAYCEEHQRKGFGDE